MTLGIIAVFDFLVRQWSVLNQAYFVGTQPDNAETVGINVGRVIFVGFVISGLFSGFAAIFMSSHLGIGYSQFAGGMALRALAAAVVGGADFTGGKGSVWGAFLVFCCLRSLQMVLFKLAYPPIGNKLSMLLC